MSARSAKTARVGRLDDRAIAERRAFLKRAGAVALTAPAVALLLSSGAKAITIDDQYGPPCIPDDICNGDNLPPD